MIIIEVDIYTGVLEYKGINFSFVFDKQELRLIPPKDKKKKIEHEWFMHKIGEGVYAGGDHPQMEQPFLVGTCNEDGNKMIFITQEGTYIGRYNFVLRIEVIAFLVLRYRECSINKMCFLSPEINCIHSIGQSFCFEYDEDFHPLRVAGCPPDYFSKKFHLIIENNPIKLRQIKIIKRNYKYSN